MGVDYYKLLGVTKDASEDDIKKAYKKMVRNFAGLRIAIADNLDCAGAEMAPRPEQELGRSY